MPVSSSPPIPRGLATAVAAAHLPALVALMRGKGWLIRNCVLPLLGRPDDTFDTVLDTGENRVAARARHARLDHAAVRQVRACGDADHGIDAATGGRPRSTSAPTWACTAR